MSENSPLVGEEIINENPDLLKPLESDSEMKEWLINYVGEKCRPDDEHVTVEMIINVFVQEFPEFLLAIAEENWIRGYHQALVDVEEGEKILENESDDISDEEWVEGYKECKNCDCGKCE